MRLISSTFMCFSIIISSSAYASEVSSRVELLQTGESARVNSPECSQGGGVTAADVLLKVGAAAIDAYTGSAFASTVLNHLPPGNVQWVKDRFGISNGKSSCTTQCISYPSDPIALLRISFSETGGDGYSEKVSNEPSDLNGDYATNYVGVINASIASTEKTDLFCATGKNWSHNRNRWFTITAYYQ